MLLIKKLAVIITVMCCLAACGPKEVDYLDNKDVKAEILSYNDEGEFLEARLAFTGRSRSTMVQTVYRVEWYDEDDVAVENSAWRPLTIHGKQRIFVTERATRPGAARAMVIISNEGL